MSSGMLHRVAWCTRALLLCQATRSHIPVENTDLTRALVTTDQSITTYFVGTVPLLFALYLL